jgi:hypothetical protein
VEGILYVFHYFKQLQKLTALMIFTSSYLNDIFDDNLIDHRHAGKDLHNDIKDCEESFMEGFNMDGNVLPSEQARLDNNDRQ